VWRKASVAAVLIAVVSVELHGFSIQNLFAQHIWDTDGLHRLARFTGVFLAAAIPILMLAPWSFARLMIGFVAVGTVISVGPWPAIAVILFLLSSWTLGMRVLGAGEPDSLEAHLLGMLTGVGLYVALMTLLAFWPVNYPVVWGAVLIVPILLGWRAVRRGARYWRTLRVSTELRSWPQRCASALFVFVMLMHWLVVLGPEKSADGLAMHLAITTNIATRHAYTFQPAIFVWAVMPKGADFAYSIVYLIGGEFGARLLNLAMLLLLEGLLYTSLRRTTSRAVSLFLAALFATTPLVQLVTGSLFVENTMAAMVFGALAALWSFSETKRRGFLYAAMVLGGTALAVKAGSASFLAVALPFAVSELAKLRKAPASCVLAVALFLVAGVPAYGIAWWKTGNPIFPFKNEKIHSPLLDPAVQFQDNEFRQPLKWTTPFDLTFRTHEFYEGQNGTLGFQYLLFLPLGFLAILFTPGRRTVGSLVISLGAAILILRAEPNTRYIYSAMPLLFIPFGSLLGWARPNRRLYGILLILTGMCAALNLYFLPGSGWYHKDFHMHSPFSQTARERYTRDNVPIRPAMEQFNRVHPGASIFLANDEDVADPLGDVYEGGWHQFNTLDQLRKARTLAAMGALFEKWGVHYFASRKDGPGESRDPALLSDFLEKCTVKEYQLDQIRVSRMELAGCEPQPAIAPGMSKQEPR
jgi:hypothetical protein